MTVFQFLFFSVDPVTELKRRQERKEKFSKPAPRVEKGGRMTRLQITLKKEDKTVPGSSLTTAERLST